MEIVHGLRIKYIIQTIGRIKMSDGISDANREAREWSALDNALYQLETALDNMHDSIWGLPIGAKEEIELVLRKYGLSLTNLTK